MITEFGHPSDSVCEMKPTLSLALFEQLHQLADRQSLSENQTKRHVSWILRYLRFLNQPSAKNTDEMLDLPSHEFCSLHGKHSVEAFLAKLATEDFCEPTAQLQAEQALIFFYQQFLKTTLGDLHFPRLKQRRGFFSRFGETHCAAVLCKMTGASQLMAKLAVATHLKLRQVINLRVADINLKKNTITVRNTDDSVKFITLIPVQLVLDLRIQLMKVNALVTQQNERAIADHEESTLFAGELIQASAQFLFPYRYPLAMRNSLSISTTAHSSVANFNATPLCVLKNDIRIAIQSYRRFLPETTASEATIRMPRQVPSQRQLTHEKRQIARNNHLANLQKSFNFWDELGAA